MKIIKKKSLFSVFKTVNYLKKNKICVIPTDTVYGISGKVPDSDEAIRKIKGREETKPFIQLIGKPSDIYKYTDKKIPENIMKMLPCALTLIVPLKNGSCDGASTIALRCPDDNWLRKVINRCGFSVYSTSVNRSGQPLIKTVGEMQTEFPEIDLIVDNGEMDFAPSTIISLVGEKPEIVRQGSVYIT